MGCEGKQRMHRKGSGPGRMGMENSKGGVPKPSDLLDRAGQTSLSRGRNTMGPDACV